MSPVLSDEPTALRLLPLLLVSLVAVGTEIALTRFFALASWSEYGYWVISITMVGLTASGVVASLADNWLRRHGVILLSLLPLALLVAAAGGWYATTIIPFNPLELQNRELWHGQVGNIFTYYAALFPFFFLAGLYISLFFLQHSARIGRVYAFDLAGAGIGALVVVGAMFVVHPFELVAVLVPFLALAALAAPPPGGNRLAFAALVAVVLALAEAVLLLSPARINEYKEIFPPLNAPASRIVAEIRSPKGLYQLVDAFTERVDTDTSNNPVPGVTGEMPRAFGLYHDGNRAGSVAREPVSAASYAPATLDALPYLLRRPQTLLLIGGGGGFRVGEARTLGAGHITVIESDRVLVRNLRQGLAGRAPVLEDATLRIVDSGALGRSLPPADRFDLIDLSRDFLSQSDINRMALTADGMAELLQRLTPDGVLSIPVSVREFTNYAVKMFATAHRALRRHGIERNLQSHVLVYRSAWNVRILLSLKPWTPEAIAAARAFCRERSFDLIFHAGIDRTSLEVFNELPVVTFGSSAPPVTHDALADEAAALLDGWPAQHHGFFDLRPSTFDRPIFYSTLPLGELPAVLRQVELVPREELPSLINLAVLAQALLIAAIVLLLPLVRPASSRPPLGAVGAAVLYFSGLGLGFLWLEIYLIEKAAWYLHDRTIAFALVLATMLIASGAGSLYAERFTERPRRGLTIAVAGVLSWCVLAWLGLDRLLAATAAVPLALQMSLIAGIAAVLALFLGLPMAIGLRRFHGPRVSFLPWAWAVNGAWSIVATPVANLVVLVGGLKFLVVGAAISYLLVWGSLSGFTGLRRDGR